MRTPVYTSQFYKDVKQMQKRGRAMDALKEALRTLCDCDTMSYTPYSGYRLFEKYSRGKACRIQDDWFLIYKVRINAVVFLRTGTYDDLYASGK